MSLDNLAKNHPNLLAFLVIAFIMAIASVIFVALTGNYMVGFVAFLLLTAYFSLSIIKSSPTKEMDAFLKNISSQEIVSVKKNVTGCVVKTKDFELNIVYFPEVTNPLARKTLTDVLLPLDLRAVDYGVQKSVEKFKDIANSSWGNDVLAFSFELPKNQVANVFKNDGTFNTNIYERWHQIKNQLGDYASLVNSGLIQTIGDKVYVLLTFDRKKAIENSTQVYETIKQARNKVIGRT